MWICHEFVSLFAIDPHDGEASWSFAELFNVSTIGFHSNDFPEAAD
jgi:hypothetical protein